MNNEFDKKLTEMATKRAQVRAAKLVLAFIAGLGGYIILFMVDWRIALGVFVVHFSMNLERGSN